MLRPGPIALVVALLTSTAIAASSTGCMPRPRMCTATTECPASNACVAGRCQPEKANVKPAIDSARRVVYRPVDVAYVARGDEGTAGEGSIPPQFRLGHAGGSLLLRFAVPLPETTSVVEAYVVLHRAATVDDDPAAISLHATRIVEPWSGRSISWATQPRARDGRTPSTVVEPGGPSIVRLDVRDLVRQWFKHDPEDQGIAVVAENESRTGTTFAYAALGAAPTPDVEPYLELYLR